MTAKRLTPLIHHDWLGDLYRYQDNALVGELQIDPRVRSPRNNGQTDAEVLLELDSIEPGPRLNAQLATVTTRIKAALANLAAIRAYGVEHGPADWREYCEPLDERPLVERLFLDGFEVKQDLDVTACFDFGDLDTLIVHLDPDGHGRAVALRL
jgi:hypothetical protein